MQILNLLFVIITFLTFPYSVILSFKTFALKMNKDITMQKKKQICKNFDNSFCKSYAICQVP